TNSLSIALPLGTHTRLRLWQEDEVVVNGEKLAPSHPFHIRLHHFLDLFRFTPDMHFQVETQNEIPTGAGLASSASGFAACVLALNDLFSWNLERTKLSILARLGSGSACRSLFSGFVEWQAGL